MAWYFWALLALAAIAFVALLVSAWVAHQRRRLMARKRQAIAREQARSEAAAMRTVQDTVEDMFHAIRGYQ